MKLKLNGYYNYTVILTYVGMLSGFGGLVFVLNDRLWAAVICLLIAGVCDMFDGAIASTRKRTDSEKRFGIQIDSLSDLICFGVLPALIGYCACGKRIVALIAGGLYVLCALIRLAYFNVMEEERQRSETGRRTSYQGLPVTASAVIFPLLFAVSWWIPLGSVVLIPAGIVAMAVAFVVPFRVSKPHHKGKVLLLILGTVAFALVMLNVFLIWRS